MAEYGKEAPVFNIDWESMWTKSFTAFVEECRFKKGAYKYPFFKIRPPTEFMKLFDLKKRQHNTDFDATYTAVRFQSNTRGVYFMTASENTGRSQSLKEHLSMMQQTTVDDWKIYYDRRRLRAMKGYNYMENLDLSIMEEIYTDRTVSLPPGWNLNALPELKSILGRDIPGVTKSMSYAGEEYTYAPIHIEDLGFGSANALFPHSAPKIWTGFEKKYYGAVKAATKRNFKTTCSDILLHKCIMYDLDFYNDNKLPYYYAIQGPGEFIVTNPTGFHGVANTGRNFSEAVNFYCMGTVSESLNYPLCDCPEVVQQYQCEEWQNYIQYCQNVEQCMVSDEITEPIVEIYRNETTRSTTLPSLHSSNLINEEEAAESQPHTESEEESSEQILADAEEEVAGAQLNTDDAPEYIEMMDEEEESTESYTEAAAPSDVQQQHHAGTDEQFIESVDIFADDTPDETATQTPHDINDPLVQSVLQMLQPNVHFASQIAPPPTMEPVSSIERRASAEVGLRYRAIRTMLRVQPTDTRSENTAADERLERRKKHLERRKKQYTASAASRKKAHQKHEATRAGTRNDRKRGIIALSFQRDFEQLKRERERIGTQIQNHYSRVHVVSAKELQEYYASKNTTERTTQQLIRSRDVCNALIKYFTKNKVFARLAEGSTVYGIVNHFLNFDNPTQAALFKQCLINGNAHDMNHWDTVLSSRENWINEFGFDYAFRIPATDTRLFCERELTDASEEDGDGENTE